MAELLGDCPIAFLVASDFHKVVSEATAEVNLIRYEVTTDLTAPSFDEIQRSLVPKQ